MKKMFFAMLLCVISISVSAQEHLTFKGVPIDGSMNSFMEKLEAIGFTRVFVRDDAALMKGNFGGEVCKTVIFSTKTSKIVYTVCVDVETSNSWHTLKSTYDDYKSLLTAKYGAGISREYFSYPYDDHYDGHEMTALRLGKCNYWTRFSTTKGDITLAISYMEEASVVLYYTDKVNKALSESEEKTLLSNDL